VPLLGFSRFAALPSRVEIQPGGAVWFIPDQASTLAFSNYVVAHTVDPGLISPDALFAVKEVASIFTGGGGGTAMFDSPPGGDDMANGNGSVDPWGAGEFGTGSGDTWGSGGPDVNMPADWGGALDLGGLPSVVGDIANAAQGGLVPVGAGAAVGDAGVVAGGLALRSMSQIVAGAILKLKQTLGGGGFLTAGGIASFGARTWQALTSWATRNPGLSVISTLVGLGLTVEEAAHFLAWGAVHKRRRRHRGISYRDMRTTRRTMSRVISMSHQLRALCGAVPHRSFGRHRHAVVNLPRRR